MEVCCDRPTAPGIAVPPTQPFLCFLGTDTLLGEREQDKATGFKKEGVPVYRGSPQIGC